MNDESAIKKNILDLQYNQFLQYYTTVIILFFTYIIGLLLAIIANEGSFSIAQIGLMVIITLLFSSVMVALLLLFRSHLSRILKEMKSIPSATYIKEK